MSNVRVNLGLVVGRDAEINRSPEISISGGDGVTLIQNNDAFRMEADTTGIQSKLNGQAGQYISFDENGSMIPVDKPFELYGFEFDNLESNPESKIRYFGDNVNYTPARMGTSSFDYGDWGNAFFIKNLKPCMLNYDGSVAYDLDKNDYSKKADGTASDIANEAFGGNAMVGIPTVWIKVDTTNADMPRVYISDKQIDDTYHAYAHHDNAGNAMPYTYLPIYNGWLDSNIRLRSLSGKSPKVADIGRVQIPEARANNPSGTDIWDIEKFVDCNLINLLLMLISKTTNTQAAFGKGYTGQSQRLSSGILNSSGLFWGSISSEAFPVKVFGIENWWGNIERRIFGLLAMNPDNTIYYKLTKGTEDGSTVYGFDQDAWLGSSEPYGWINSHLTKSGGYVKSIAIGEDASIIPYEAGASDSTYMCDYQAYNLNITKPIAMFGGNTSESIGAIGAFGIGFSRNSETGGVRTGASISCKPNVL